MHSVTAASRSAETIAHNYRRSTSERSCSRYIHGIFLPSDTTGTCTTETCGHIFIDDSFWLSFSILVNHCSSAPPRCKSG